MILRATRVNHGLPLKRKADAIISTCGTNHRNMLSEPCCRELLEHERGVVTAHLNNGAQLFIEQFPRKLAALLCQPVKLDFNTGAACERHFH